MKWHDDILLEKSPVRRGNLQLAMYAMHLATGSTLLCKAIKCSTIKEYVKAAASIMGLLGKEIDYRRENPTDKAFCPSLQAVYNELQRWERVPNRREPFTLEMLADVQSQAQTSTLTDGPDSLLPVLADWFEVGLFSGLRKSEWAQDAGCHHLSSPKQSPLRRAQAFTLSDIKFKLMSGQYIPASQLGDIPITNPVVRVWVTHSWQKNHDNGEQRLFVRNERVKGRCACRAWERIVRRFLRIRGPNDEVTPLALFLPKLGTEPHLVTSADIDKVMRNTASRVYNLDPIRHKTELQRWSSHSLRVGACTILHAMGFNNTQIKWLLRWRSDAFMTYLRNLAVNSRQHVLAMDKAAAMPQFL
jgi:hypothetical protein